jgi:hypothetical protein
MNDSWKLWELIDTNNINIRASHFLSASNVLADSHERDKDD